MNLYWKIDVRLIEQEHWNKVSGRCRTRETLNIDYENLFEDRERYREKKMRNCFV